MITYIHKPITKDFYITVISCTGILLQSAFKKKLEVDIADTPVNLAIVMFFTAEWDPL